MSNSSDSIKIPITSYLPPTDNDDPLLNLSCLRSKIDSLHQFLSHTLTPLSQTQLDFISDQISFSLRHVIINATALLSSTSPYPFSGFSIPNSSIFNDLDSFKLMGSTENSSLFNDSFLFRLMGSTVNSSIFNDLEFSKLRDSTENSSLFNELDFAKFMGFSKLMGSTENSSLFNNLDFSKLMGSTENGSSDTKSQAEEAKEVVFVDDWDMVKTKLQVEKVKEVFFVDDWGIEKTKLQVEKAKEVIFTNDYDIGETNLVENAKEVVFVNDWGIGETKLQVGKAKEEVFVNDWDIVELDSIKLLAEHIHFCEICGKGFKRDANLRMHMRAHGFKTPEALSKLVKINRVSHNMRFSCPYIGCCRNKGHGKFRPLKSAICVKNHFKRSHCPKMYSCNRCNKKSFSGLADLKSHLRHCAEAKWKCSCGTTFSRKDKLFGHMALFEGHMPTVGEEGERERLSVVAMDDDYDDQNKEGEKRSSFSDDGFFDGFGDMSNGNTLQDVLGMGSPSGLGNSMDELFEF